MSVHFVDCFFHWAEAFMFDVVSLVDYCFCWLCFWYYTQNFTAKVPVEKLIPYVFCRPGSPLSHALLQARTRSAEIWALAAVSPASLLSVWPPVVRLCKVGPERTSREASWSSGETGCPPWVLSFPLEKPWVRGRGWAFSVWPCAGLGNGLWGQKEAAPLPLLSVLLDLCCPGGASASPLGSGMFLMVSCPWVVSGWPSWEGD